MKLAFDIDGTCLTQGSPEKDYRDSKAIKEMIALVNKLYDSGHEIYFFTARHFKHFLWTEEQLKSAGFKYHGLVMNKISCDLYIDDKGFRWTGSNFPELEDILNGIKL